MQNLPSWDMQCHCDAMQSSSSVLFQSEDCIMGAYNLVRIPAKEVFIAMLSDMDRQHKRELPHAIPIAYGLSGYSLKVDSIRELMLTLILQCEQNGMRVDAVSADGQFCRLAIRDKDGRPLTLLQLQKDVWEKCKKMTKADQMKQVTQLNDIGRIKDFDTLNERASISIQKNDDGDITSPIIVGCLDQNTQTVFTPQNIKQLIISPSKKKTNNIDDDNTNSDNSNEIDLLNYLPIEVIELLDEDTQQQLVTISKQLPNRVTENFHLEESFMQHPEENVSDTNFMESNEPVDNISYRNDTNIGMDSGAVHMNFQAMLDVLLAFEMDVKRVKWCHVTLGQFKEYFSSALIIAKTFTKKEMLLMIGSSGQYDLYNNIFGRSLSGASKTELVNTLSIVLGDKSQMSGKNKTVPKLQNIIKKMIKSWPKLAWNAITAVNSILGEVTKWRKESKCFHSEASVVFSNSMQETYVFYSFPEYINDLQRSVPFLLDTHHLFVNSRSLVCAKGIPSRGVCREAWLNVAKSNTTDLNVAMVDDLIDRQSNTLARITYSEKVEEQMLRLNYFREANFCRVMRSWYEAEDEPSLSAEERYKRRLKLREFVLKDVSFTSFPPPGSHINGIPYVMFEGLLTNIDRRIQLYAIVKKGTYNVRAPTSLDSENFFGEFQSLDPKGTGVLFPDDVPKAMETAAYILNARVDPNRYIS